ncbi:DEAD-domain-containing protein [Venturia nashicola]|uniref:RNA helicase n=1 Tax=Venturia nashicola TaxID=86259 RepID=A0A4Z1P133_9PEZI|nr:DEAD-domain-containing protein [Venturia nashicola]
MGKRKQEESVAANGFTEVPVSKKVRKEKHTEVSFPVPVEEDSERKSNKSKKEPKSVDPEDAEAITKAERKALRKAKKAAKEEEKTAGPTEDAEAIAKAERKALKKAKKAKKEAKKEGQESGKSTEVPEEPEEEESKTAKKAEKSKKDKKGAAKAEAAADSEEWGDGTSSLTGYTEASGLSNMPQADIDAYLSSKEITIADDSGDKHLRPITNFKYLPVTDKAERAPFAAFKSPTPIQAAAWPYLLNGRDVIGVAETGSGKTMAFGVPCLRYIKSLANKDRGGVKAVMVSPTRELALQIAEQLEKLATPAGIKVVCVYGGGDKQTQRNALRTAHIVVATPGRLNDLIEEGSANLSQAAYVVLDEADRMLDVGFEQAIRKIIGAIRSQRQTLMFTATWPQSVRELASTFMKKPVKIIIGDNPTGELRANTRITQVVEVVQQFDKQQRLIQLLKEHQSGAKKNDKILVFCLYKKEADRIEHFVRDRGFNVAGIHGDLSQVQRFQSLDAFKRGDVTILVATDVAARGLDIPNVMAVINVTFPLTVEDYVHRIGRTGRAGLPGKAVTMFTEQDKGLSGALINVLRAANQPVPEALLKFGTTVKKKEHSAYGAFFKEVDMTKKASKITFD